MSSPADVTLLSDHEVVGTYDPWRRPPQLSLTYAQPRPRRVGLDLQRTTWFQPVADRFVDLMRLPRGWDSYGGVALRENYAALGLWFLTQFLEPDSMPPWVVPLSDGGVQFEWHRHGLDVEVVFSPTETEAVIKDEAQGVEWEGAPDDLIRGSATSIRSHAVSALRSE